MNAPRKKFGKWTSGQIGEIQKYEFDNGDYKVFDPADYPIEIIARLVGQGIRTAMGDLTSRVTSIAELQTEMVGKENAWMKKKWGERTSSAGLWPEVLMEIAKRKGVDCTIAEAEEKWNAMDSAAQTAFKSHKVCKLIHARVANEKKMAQLEAMPDDDLPEV